MGERRVGATDAREPLDPFVVGRALVVAGEPQVLTIRWVVAAREALLGAVVDAGDPVLGEDEEQRVVERRRVVTEIQEAANVVVVEEVHQRLVRRDPDAVRAAASVP